MQDDQRFEYDPNPSEQDTFWFHWYKEIHCIFLINQNLIITLVTAVLLSAFLVSQLTQSQGGEVNNIALGLLIHVVALLLLPIMRSHDLQTTFKGILQGYKYLIFSVARLLYACMLLLVPFGLIYLSQKLNTVSQIGEGTTLALIAPFFLVLFFGFLHSVALDQSRGVSGKLPIITTKPWLYFNGFGRALGNSIIVRILIGIPLFIYDTFAYELVEGETSLLILFSISIFGNLVMSLLAVRISVSRMQFSG
jgi:hypothetical protein